jgi:hypothetical protein
VLLGIPQHVSEKLEPASGFLNKIKSNDPEGLSLFVFHFNAGLLFRQIQLSLELPDGGTGNPLDIHPGPKLKGCKGAWIHCEPKLLMAQHPMRCVAHIAKDLPVLRSRLQS